MYLLDYYSQGLYVSREYFYTHKTNTYKDIEQFLADDKDLLQKFTEEKKTFPKKEWKLEKRKVSEKYFSCFLTSTISNTII